MTYSAIIGFAEVIFLLIIALFLLNGVIFRHYARKKKAAAATMTYQERLNNPKFEELEKHFGRAFPQDLKALYYNNPSEIHREIFQVNGKETRWGIAFYQPADLKSLMLAVPKTNEVFEFANDGTGNGYTIDPAQDNPPVMFYDHETGTWHKVADNFSAFMAMPRC